MTEPDLSAAGAAIRALPLDPPTPVATLRHRQHRRRRTRRVVTGAGAMLLVAVLVAVGVAFASRPGSARLVTSSPQATVPIVQLPAIAHPAGWKPIDFGDLRLWVPPGWQADTSFNGCLTTSYTNRLTLEPATDGCGETVTTHLAVRRDRHDAPAGWSSATINGVTVWTHRAAGSTTYAVPSLGVRITATGAGANEVARTLGPSSLDALTRMTGPVAVPASWRTVRFDGFEVDVPKRWPIWDLSADCGTLFSGTPDLFEGEPRFAAKCEIVLPIYLLRPGDGLWMETATGPHAPATSGGLRTDNLGVIIHPASSTMGGMSGVPIANLTAVAGTHVLQAQLGLGPNPAIAEEVLSSLRYVGRSQPNTPVDTLPPAATTVPRTIATPPATVPPPG